MRAILVLLMLASAGTAQAQEGTAWRVCEDFNKRVYDPPTAIAAIDRPDMRCFFVSYENIRAEYDKPLPVDNKRALRNIKLAPYIFLTAGQAADVWTKRIALSRGCIEANTYAYRSERPTTARLISTKLLLVGPVTLTAALLDRHGHRKAAGIIASGGGSAGVIIATWNLSIRCGR